MKRKKKAVLFMLLAALSFSFMTVMIKLAGDIPTLEKVLFRNVGSLTIFFLLFHRKGIPLLGRRKNQVYLLGRSVFGTIAMGMIFYAVNNMYLADASMLNKLNPFFVTLLAAIFLKEKLSRLQFPALIIAFLASLLIIKPRFDLEILPSLAAVGSALFSAAAHVSVRFLNSRERPATIVFYFAFVSTLLILPFVIPNFVLPQGIQWLYLVSIGIFAAIGQLSMTNAFKNEKASEVTIYNYISILFAAILGFVIWGEVSDILSIIGGIIIISVAVSMYFYNKRQHNKDLT